MAKLKRGELLSPQSTARLLDVMSRTHTGPNRLKGGLAAGWTLSHKTGTGQELGGVQAGYNDIGILTAPDGKSYSVAVMIKKTSTPLPVRMTLMNNVVEAVIAQHDSDYDGHSAASLDSRSTRGLKARDVARKMSSPCGSGGTPDGPYSLRLSPPRPSGFTWTVLMLTNSRIPKAPHSRP